MNAQKERRSDSKNFGTRITRFGVVVEKILIFEVLELFLWIFSEARDLFVNIFQIFGPNCKITDCGLISEKPRGLSAKSAKLDHGLISKKHRGFFAKRRGVSVGYLFFNG
jgi:hypothetical protein